MKITILVLLVWNLLVFSLYGIDKLLAKGKKRRISEATLLVTALCMGAAGGLFGMVIWNHKTAKLKFRLTVPLCFFLNFALLWLVAVQLWM
ncbi:MAG: DUF1294 domain-containing protein [Clostridia bacterium]|nr:DUF1294 domain-containing protein [Clostridia bacterium]